LAQTVTAPRARKSFSRLKHVLDLPNLIDIQRESFDWFLREGLRETIDDISPIEDYTGSLAVEFGDYMFGLPQFSIQECREKDLTYQAPLSMTVRFVNKDTGEIREQTVFMGDFPMMTTWGTFIINGTERVIVTQLVRSPGAYLMEPKDPTKQVFIANLMPSRGSWLELEIDKKGVVYARIDRKRKLPITTLLRALPAEDPTTGFALDTSTDEAILKLFNNSHFMQATLEKDTTTREEEALIEVFKKQRPGEPPTLDNARNLLRSLFFDPKRYDLTKVGRYKLNQRLGVDVPDDCRVLTTQDILALVQKLVSMPHTLGVPEDSKDYAADRGRARRVRALWQPPPPHHGRADPGGVPRRPVPDGARRPRADDDRGRRHDHTADDHQHPSRRRGAEGVLRLVTTVPVHAADELARRAHAPASSLGTRCRRAHP
jgi:DNA-directed RNA polymerase subunit beta